MEIITMTSREVNLLRAKDSVKLRVKTNNLHKERTLKTSTPREA
jgi:hypothetical protein